MDAVAKAELRERCAANDVKPFDDLYDIEYTAMTIKDLTHKIDIQKGTLFKMFNLSEDPQEKLDIAGNPDVITEQLKGKLLERYIELEKPGTQANVMTGPDQIEILRSLGYVD